MLNDKTKKEKEKEIDARHETRFVRMHARSVRQPLKSKGNQNTTFFEKATSASSRMSFPWNCQCPPVRAADVSGIVVEDAVE
jgi:hypothetical protein